MNSFQGGRVYWSAATGAHDVYGGILARYLATGGEAGALGLPTSGETDWPGGRSNAFQNGRITWNASNGSTNVVLNNANFSNLRHPRTGQPFYPNVIRWAPTVSKALADLGFDQRYIPGVLAQMQQESSGIPDAVNTWDINWQRGYASFGLLQTIAPTYQAYAPPGQRGVLTSKMVNGRAQQFVPEMIVPYNNIYAGINYATKRYGPGKLDQWNAGQNQAYSADPVAVSPLPAG